jgi:hypothetical protein
VLWDDNNNRDKGDSIRRFANLSWVIRRSRTRGTGPAEFARLPANSISPHRWLLALFYFITCERNIIKSQIEEKKIPIREGRKILEEGRMERGWKVLLWVVWFNVSSGGSEMSLDASTLGDVVEKQCSAMEAASNHTLRCLQLLVCALCMSR